MLFRSRKSLAAHSPSLPCRVLSLQQQLSLSLSFFHSYYDIFANHSISIALHVLSLIYHAETKHFPCCCGQWWFIRTMIHSTLLGVWCLFKPESNCCYANRANIQYQYPIPIAIDTDQLDFQLLIPRWLRWSKKTR